MYHKLALLKICMCKHDAFDAITTWKCFPHIPLHSVTHMSVIRGWSSSLFCVCESWSLLMIGAGLIIGLLWTPPLTDSLSSTALCLIKAEPGMWRLQWNRGGGGAQHRHPSLMANATHKTPPVPSAMQKLTRMNLEHVTMHWICTVLVYTTAMFTCTNFH